MALLDADGSGVAVGVGVAVAVADGFGVLDGGAVLSALAATVGAVPVEAVPVLVASDDVMEPDVPVAVGLLLTFETGAPGSVEVVLSVEPGDVVVVVVAEGVVVLPAAVDALGDEAEPALPVDEELSPPEAAGLPSACATPVPLSKAAPRPTPIAPVLNHFDAPDVPVVLR